jgi:hypothetical protein
VLALSEDDVGGRVGEGVEVLAVHGPLMGGRN